jgi:hypothetical protein
MGSFHRLRVGLRLKMVDFASIPGTICDRELSPPVKHLCENQFRFLYLSFACMSELEEPKDTDLGTGKFFDKYHYTGFTDG